MPTRFHDLANILRTIDKELRPLSMSDGKHGEKGVVTKFGKRALSSHYLPHHDAIAEEIARFRISAALEYFGAHVGRSAAASAHDSSQFSRQTEVTDLDLVSI